MSMSISSTLFVNYCRDQRHQALRDRCHGLAFLAGQLRRLKNPFRLRKRSPELVGALYGPPRSRIVPPAKTQPRPPLSQLSTARHRSVLNCAPFHSITPSAPTSSEAGAVRSSAIAVLRVTTISYFTGACTGRSAGFSPLRMRST